MDFLKEDISLWSGLWNFTELLSFPQSYKDITDSQQSSPLLVATDCNPFFLLPPQVGNVNKYPLQLMGSS